MKTIIFSLDTALIELIKKLDSIFTKQLIFYQGSTDPLDVMSFVCSEISSILIIDDDFLKPNTAHILRSVRKLHKKVVIIFVTSNTSIELGREISQLGMYYYAIKPVDKEEISDILESILKKQNKN